MALGATPGNVLALVFRQGLFNAATGLAIGLGLTIVLIRVLRGVLVGLESGTSGHVSIAVSFVSLTAAIACWFPARRAARIEPMSALRQELSESSRKTCHYVSGWSALAANLCPFSRLYLRLMFCGVTCTWCTRADL
jgi:predicted lysophospholipase L1 biosynthesis ABC-type transport system permease subunit